MIHASAPGRVGVIGNPSDIYGGTVISCTIGERADVFVREAEGLCFDICGHVTEIHGPEDFTFDTPLPFLNVAKAVWLYLTGDDQRFLNGMRVDPTGNFTLRAETTIPMRAGCAGSTAMLVAILAGILAHFGHRPNRYQLAELARHIERTKLGVDCGFQDQYMVVFGGLNCVDCRDKEYGWDNDSAPYATVERLMDHLPDDMGVPIVLANTGRRQGTSGTYHAPPRQRWENGDKQMVEGIERIAQLARLGKRAVLRQDWEEVGALMNENYRVSCELFGISEINDTLINAALKHGALGAKLAGAGGGGTIIAIHGDPDYLAQRLQEHDAKRIIPIDPLQHGVAIMKY